MIQTYRVIFEAFYTVNLFESYIVIGQKSRSCGIYMRAVSREVLRISIHQISLKMVYVKLLPHLPGANELRLNGLDDIP